MDSRVLPRLLTIPPSQPFLPALAQALGEGRLIDGVSVDDPLSLAACTLMLPNRRSCRQMRAAFLALGRPAMLLPRLVPLGDIDEDEAALAGAELLTQAVVPPFERRLMLATLIRAFGERLSVAQPGLAAGEAPLVGTSAADALALSAQLMELMDQVATERVPWSRLDGIVDTHLDRYWQITRQFLAIASENWPGMLADRGWIDGAVARDIRLSEEARRIAARPGPFIAAGSTGSIAATRDLLAAVALHPRGAVILPGFDRAMDGDQWRSLRTPGAQVHGHPQYGMARLVAQLGLTPADVVEMAPPLLPERDRLTRIALRPIDTTERWQEEAATLSPDAGAGLTLLEAANEQEEALACAVALRRLAEDPARTAALVTPDRALAGRVSAELQRWGIAYDDSGGEPLLGTAAAVVARLTARLALDEALAVDVLALLDHPAISLPALKDPSAALSALDLVVLRGLTAGGRLDEMLKACDRPLRRTRGGSPLGRVTPEAMAEAVALLEWLTGALAPLATLTGTVTLPQLASAHLDVLARLGLKAETVGLSEVVEALSALASVAVAPFPVAAGEYPQLFEALLAPETCRRPGAEGARIRILGLPEARLLEADLVILAGLTEGGWPRPAGLDPWLNRAMRMAMGIEPPERRIGLAAHDFAQALGNREVILSRADKLAGVPAVPSRWLQRLDAVLGKERTTPMRARGGDILALARTLDTPKAVMPLSRPRPTPPVELRPTRLSVTEIEKLQRDPYAIYARHVLKLVPLDPYDVPIGASERGTLVHDALAGFVSEIEAEGWPADPLAALLRHGRSAFADYWHHADVQGFWWPRFERIAGAFVALEHGRQGEIVGRVTERDGALEWDLSDQRRFRLTARADRLDRLADGTLAIIDYKTGAPPSNPQARKGLAPQLPLEAAIAKAGGFGDDCRRPVSRLSYIRLTGLEPALKVSDVTAEDGDTLEDLSDKALTGLKELISLYESQQQPYLPWAMPKMMRAYGGDYDHLSRVGEWGSAGEDEE